MKSNLLPILGLLALALTPARGLAQRQQMSLGRGVIAAQRDSKVTVTWRRLAQEPEDAKYNLYVDRTGAGSYVKLAGPILRNNYQAQLSAIPYGSQLAVSLVDADGKEGALSVPFHFVDNSWANAAIRVNYKRAGSPVVNREDTLFTSKFCWPVDLNGDGEMEYVVNRVYNHKDMNGYEGHGADKLGGDYLEAYTRDGRHLWTVNLGIHFFAFGGQNDGVTVGDFDGDGRGEVCVQVCEGARLWDAENRCMGKYLYYNGQQASSTGSGMQTVSSDGSNPDIDGDGVVNYTYYNRGKNPQHYMLIIDGMTGEQKDVCPMTMPKDRDMEYTRTNKSAFMNDEYPYMSAAMGSAFLDGVHQSIVAQFQVRTNKGVHHYFTYAYGYEGGEFRELFRFPFWDNGNPSEFHHIRIGDVDGDGCDEVMNGAYALDNTGKMLWNSGIGHGDRFRMSDIDPDRPGQEIFAIQQNAPDMLGTILYSAFDGTSIKRWYMSSVGDVGRGECMDVDPKYKGYEMWSTLPNMYNAQGEVISSEHPYPYEGVWWDDDLLRECAWTPGSGDDAALVIGKYDGGTGYTRQIQPSRESGWAVALETGVRPLFWGDILGDWREEVILTEHDATGDVGFVLYATNYTTSVNNIYCLLEDPNYFGQITNRGYYQSPNTSFYLGYDMPRPPLPPTMKADDATAVYDLTLGNVVVAAPSQSVQNAYFMPVREQTLTLNSPVEGGVALWKGMQGTLVVNADITTTGKVVVSEGTLEVNGTVESPIELRARGVLSGKGTVGKLSFEGSLNYAEGVIRPTETLTVQGDLTFDKKTFVDIDLDKGTGLKVNGNLAITQPLVFNIASTQLQEGTYRMVEYTGEFNGDVALCEVQGIVGLSYEVVNAEGAISLVIHGQRKALANVHWTGNETNIWDYQTENWLVDGVPTTFVAQDSIVFDDGTENTTVNIPELMPAAGMEINTEKTYTLQGNGGLTGEGGLVKNGSGKLILATKNADYTGATVINAGTVVLKELSMQGSPSSIGVGSKSSSKWKVGKATLVFDGSSLATDRGIQLTDTATFQIPANSSTTLKGLLTGSATGVLKKTGAGQLSVSYSSANSYKSTIFAEGTIAQGTTGATLGSANSEVHVTGNVRFVQFYTTNSSDAPTFQNKLNIDEGKTLTFVGSGRGTFRSTLLGKGTIKLSSGYVRFDNFMNAKDFEGIVELGSGANRFCQDIDMQKATLVVNEDVAVTGYKAGGSNVQNFTYTLGGVQGAGTLGGGTWSIGYAGNDDAFSGTFTSTVNKYGDGCWTLTGSSTGALNVYEGTVWANCTSAATTSGKITVHSGATLKGNGQVNNLTLKQGATLGALYKSPTLKTMVGTLTVNGSLTAEEGAVIQIRTRSTATKTSTDVIAVQGNAKLNSPVIEMSELNDKYSYIPDQDIQIIKCSGTLTIDGEPVMLPAKPKIGYRWDTSALAEEGIIRVVEADITVEDITDLIDLYLEGAEGITVEDISNLIDRYLEVGSQRDTTF